MLWGYSIYLALSASARMHKFFGFPVFDACVCVACVCAALLSLPTVWTLSERALAASHRILNTALSSSEAAGPHVGREQEAAGLCFV